MNKDIFLVYGIIIPSMFALRWWLTTSTPTVHRTGKTLRISPREPPVRLEEQQVTTRVEQHKTKDIDKTSVVLDIPKLKTDNNKKDIQAISEVIATAGKKEEIKKQALRKNERTVVHVG